MTSVFCRFAHRGGPYEGRKPMPSAKPGLLTLRLSDVVDHPRDERAAMHGKGVSLAGRRIVRPLGWVARARSWVTMLVIHRARIERE